MGSHAKPRTTGRRAALSALALGATLTGVGLTAAALDPATAVLNANGADEGGAIQLSGLSTPVSLDQSPAADSIADLSAAPFLPVRSITGSATGASSNGLLSGDTPGSVGSAAEHAAPATASTSTGTEKAIKPIVASTPGKPSGTSTSTSSTGTSSTGTSGSSGSSGSSGFTGSGSTGTGSTGTTGTQPRSAAPPAADSALTSVVQSTVSQVLPTVADLVSKVPVVSGLVQDTGLLGTTSSSTSTSGSGSAADPVGTVTGVVGSLPLVGSLLGGSGDGQSTVTVPGVSTIAGLL